MSRDTDAMLRTLDALDKERAAMGEKCKHCGRMIFPPSETVPFWQDMDIYAPTYCLENSDGHEPLPPPPAPSIAADEE